MSKRKKPARRRREPPTNPLPQEPNRDLTFHFVAIDEPETRYHVFFGEQALGEIHRFSRKWWAVTLHPKYGHFIARYETRKDAAAFLLNCHTSPKKTPHTGFDISAFLAYVVATIRVCGWIPQSAVWEGKHPLATADYALQAMVPELPVCGNQEHPPLPITPNTEDQQQAQQVLAWVRSLQPDPSEDYFLTLTRVLAADACALTCRYLVASAVIAYYRHLQDLQTLQEQQTSQFLGQVGERLPLVLRLTEGFLCEGRHGLFWLYKFTDEAGNIAVYYQKKAKPELPQTGRWYQVKATIFKHQLHDGIQQTLLSRLHVFGECEAPHTNHIGLALWRSELEDGLFD